MTGFAPSTPLETLSMRPTLFAKFAVVLYIVFWLAAAAAFVAYRARLSTWQAVAAEIALLLLAPGLHDLIKMLRKHDRTRD